MNMNPLLCLLDSCEEYEERKRIRMRLKALMADNSIDEELRGHVSSHSSKRAAGTRAATLGSKGVNSLSSEGELENLVVRQLLLTLTDLRRRVREDLIRQSRSSSLEHSFPLSSINISRVKVANTFHSYQVKNFLHQIRNSFSRYKMSDSSDHSRSSDEFSSDFIDEVSSVLEKLRHKIKKSKSQPVIAGIEEKAKEGKELVTLIDKLQTSLDTVKEGGSKTPDSFSVREEKLSHHSMEEDADADDEGESDEEEGNYNKKASEDSEESEESQDDGLSVNSDEEYETETVQTVETVILKKPNTDNTKANFSTPEPILHTTSSSSEGADLKRSGGSLKSSQSLSSSDSRASLQRQPSREEARSLLSSAIVKCRSREEMARHHTLDEPDDEQVERNTPEHLLVNSESSTKENESSMDSIKEKEIGKKKEMKNLPWKIRAAKKRNELMQKDENILSAEGMPKKARLVSPSIDQNALVNGHPRPYQSKYPIQSKSASNITFLKDPGNQIGYSEFGKNVDKVTFSKSSDNIYERGNFSIDYYKREKANTITQASDESDESDEEGEVFSVKDFQLEKGPSKQIASNWCSTQAASQATNVQKPFKHIDRKLVTEKSAIFSKVIEANKGPEKGQNVKKFEPKTKPTIFQNKFEAKSPIPTASSTDHKRWPTKKLPEFKYPGSQEKQPNPTSPVPQKRPTTLTLRSVVPDCTPVETAGKTSQLKNVSFFENIQTKQPYPESHLPHKPSQKLEPKKSYSLIPSKSQDRLNEKTSDFEVNHSLSKSRSTPVLHKLFSSSVKNQFKELEPLIKAEPPKIVKPCFTGKKEAVRTHMVSQIQSKFESSTQETKPEIQTRPTWVPPKDRGPNKEASFSEDPSKLLFTPEQLVKIAIHKAAINKQLDEGEKKRKVVFNRTKSLSEDHPNNKMVVRRFKSIDAPEESTKEEHQNVSFKPLSLKTGTPRRKDKFDNNLNRLPSGFSLTSTSHDKKDTMPKVHDATERLPFELTQELNHVPISDQIDSHMPINCSDTVQNKDQFANEVFENKSPQKEEQQEVEEVQMKLRLEQLRKEQELLEKQLLEKQRKRLETKNPDQNIPEKKEGKKVLTRQISVEEKNDGKALLEQYLAEQKLIEKQHLEHLRAEKQRLEILKQQRENEQKKAEQDSLEKVRLQREFEQNRREEEKRKAEQERLEILRLHRENEQKKAEQERLERLRLQEREIEQKRRDEEQKKAEQDRIEKLKFQREIEQKRAEQDRLKKLRLQQEREIEKNCREEEQKKAEQDRLEKLKLREIEQKCREEEQKKAEQQNWQEIKKQKSIEKNIPEPFKHSFPNQGNQIENSRNLQMQNQNYFSENKASEISNIHSQNLPSSDHQSSIHQHNLEQQKLVQAMLKNEAPVSKSLPKEPSPVPKDVTTKPKILKKQGSVEDAANVLFSAITKHKSREDLVRHRSLSSSGNAGSQNSIQNIGSQLDFDMDDNAFRDENYQHQSMVDPTRQNDQNVLPYERNFQTPDLPMQHDPSVHFPPTIVSSDKRKSTSITSLMEKSANTSPSWSSTKAANVFTPETRNEARAKSSSVNVLSEKTNKFLFGKAPFSFKNATSKIEAETRGSSPKVDHHHKKQIWSSVPDGVNLDKSKEDATPFKVSDKSSFVKNISQNFVVPPLPKTSFPPKEETPHSSKTKFANYNVPPLPTSAHKIAAAKSGGLDIIEEDNEGSSSKKGGKIGKLWESSLKASDPKASTSSKPWIGSPNEVAGQYVKKNKEKLLSTVTTNESGDDLTDYNQQQILRFSKSLSPVSSVSSESQVLTPPVEKIVIEPQPTLNKTKETKKPKKLKIKKSNKELGNDKLKSPELSTPKKENINKCQNNKASHNLATSSPTTTGKPWTKHSIIEFAGQFVQKNKEKLLKFNEPKDKEKIEVDPKANVSKSDTKEDKEPHYLRKSKSKLWEETPSKKKETVAKKINFAKDKDLSRDVLKEKKKLFEEELISPTEQKIEKQVNRLSKDQFSFLDRDQTEVQPQSPEKAKRMSKVQVELWEQGGLEKDDVEKVPWSGGAISDQSVKKEKLKFEETLSPSTPPLSPVTVKRSSTCNIKSSFPMFESSSKDEGTATQASPILTPGSDRVKKGLLSIFEQSEPVPQPKANQPTRSKSCIFRKGFDVVSMAPTPRGQVTPLQRPKNIIEDRSESFAALRSRVELRNKTLSDSHVRMRSDSKPKQKRPQSIGFYPVAPKSQSLSMSQMLPWGNDPKNQGHRQREGKITKDLMAQKKKEVELFFQQSGSDFTKLYSKSPSFQRDSFSLFKDSSSEASTPSGNLDCWDELLSETEYDNVDKMFSETLLNDIEINEEPLSSSEGGRRRSLSDLPKDSIDYYLLEAAKNSKLKRSKTMKGSFTSFTGSHGGVAALYATNEPAVGSSMTSYNSSLTNTRLAESRDIHYSQSSALGMSLNYKNETAPAAAGRRFADDAWKETKLHCGYRNVQLSPIHSSPSDIHDESDSEEETTENEHDSAESSSTTDADDSEDNNEYDYLSDNHNEDYVADNEDGDTNSDHSSPSQKRTISHSESSYFISSAIPSINITDLEPGAFSIPSPNICPSQNPLDDGNFRLTILKSETSLQSTRAKATDKFSTIVQNFFK